MEVDLFDNQIIKPTVEVNLYADETMDRTCPFEKNNWHYICLIVERQDKPLLQDLINKRFCTNFDENSPYYKKNNRILHWTDIGTADEKNICKRWFEYILNPYESGEKFFCYILGLNESFLNDDEFDKKDKFGSIYNRFFRTTIEYALKCFFPANKYEKVIIKKIYHEQGSQQNHLYFNWHPINKLKDEVDHFQFDTSSIEFLDKNHIKNDKANILQLCDCFLGAVVNIIHGFKNEKSNRSKIKKELLDLILPLIEMMMDEPNKQNNKYSHGNRIMIRFFPREKTTPNDPKRYINQFYSKRYLKYASAENDQLFLF